MKTKKDIKFFINDREVVAKAGETILNVARRENIYIPTMCYLEKVNPIASCRLCLVDVEGSKGSILSCQTKPTENIRVKTDSAHLYKQRQNIMKLYDVNHPLECGVCDKSGACDLQNKNIEFGIDCQDFAVKEPHRKIENWGKIQYDPSLCILCEKCVSTCNQAIGDDAIELKFGGYSSSVVLKNKNSKTLECSTCGECIAVCPVGALISTDFKYSSNTWELNTIPSICSHCSAGCEINYEVKHSSTLNHESKIYRVTNDFENSSICGAGRFGFNFANHPHESNLKNKKFDEVVNAIKKAETIIFNSQITNEEAFILQKLKEKLGLKLVNYEALNLQKFLNAFSRSSGETLPNGKIEDVENANQIIVVGSRIIVENPIVRYAMTKAFKNNRAFITYMHPVYEDLLHNIVRQFIRYEVGTEEGVIALLTEALLGQVLKFDLDVGYVSGETNVGEEELEKIFSIGKKSKKRVIIIGSDLIAHVQRENIARFLGVIQKFSNIKILLVPEESNSLGVAKICQLDEKESGNTVGYNMNGNYIISSLKNIGNFYIPALNQQEGTFINIDQKVKKLNVAVPFNGLSLNDIANKILNDKNQKQHTIEYTKNILGIDFDSLENMQIKSQEIEIDCTEMPHEISTLPTFDGTLVYNSRTFLEFNPFSAISQNVNINETVLRGSEQFATAGKISDGDEVEFEILGEKFRRKFKIDRNMRGVIALNPVFDKSLKSYLLSSIYKFQKVKIIKVAR
jgi:NADH-quinone oxidoreductase subunit G